MRIGSLFSGIGGLELGLERAGVGHTVWQVERDPFCRQVLARHWPDATRYEDVTTVDWSTVEPVEVMCGGYPCQPFSSAGRRQGERDPRHLWPFFADAIRVVRPRFVVLENVAGHLVLGFDRVLGDLASLGFDAEWSLVSAASVGAPHKRLRLFCVAYPSSTERGVTEQPSVATTGRPAELGERRSGPISRSDWWDVEPGVGVVADGVPRQLDRLRALGNAVVPQVAEVVGRRVMELAA